MFQFLALPALAGLLAVAPWAPQTPVVRPGPPGQPSTPAGAGSMSAPKASAADIAFMQGMIAHHAQALEMAALVPERSESADMKLFAKRIDVSQTDEIAMIRRWLAVRGAPVPAPMAGMTAASGAAPRGAVPAMMPGMLTDAQMAALKAAKGPAFDKLFLEGMIQHHGGALVMVRDLTQAPGALQDAEIYDFASHVDADQRMEIIRMSQMLDQMKGIKR